MKLFSFNRVAMVAAISLTPSFANANINYCESKARISSLEWIEALTVNGNSFVSGNNSGYIRHPSQVAVLYPGENKITLTPGFANNFPIPEKWIGWIDINGDDIFADSEKIFEFSSADAETISFNMLEDLDIGLATLRVVMNYEGFSSPCGEYIYGETEDLNVSIDLTLPE